MRVGLTEMLEPEAQTDNLDLATGTSCEKARRHRGSAALAKHNANRRSPEKRQTQRCTTLEKLNAVLKSMGEIKMGFSGTNAESKPPAEGG